jgi:branched-chain amino acid transport system substrate-binding protein
MRKLRVGFLFPYSGIFTKLKNDFRLGFDLAVKKEMPSLEMESIAEFINLGDYKQVEKSINKLITFDEADLIIGIVGTKVIINAREIYEKYRIPVIVNNLGGYIPTHLFRSEYLFYNSLDLWKSEWAIGKWSQRKFGGFPAVSMSIYEAGYNMHECYRLGSAMAGAPFIKMDLTKKMSGEPDTFPLISALMLHAPAHSHVLLSGREGTQFLDYYKKTSLLNNIPISVNPFMIDECLEIKDREAGHVFSACTWSYLLENAGNRSFVDSYEHEYSRSPNAYSMLAFESGLIVCAALKEMGDQNYSGEVLAKHLTTATGEGPRGKIKVSTMPVNAGHPVYIRRSFYDHKNGVIKNEVIDSDPGINWQEPEILNAAYQNTSGWENPYLCV